MADTQKQALGRLGEDIAADYLEKNGYRIVRRNQRLGKNELDIVAKNRQYIVFVEVKTRTVDTRFEHTLENRPALAVNAEKRRRTVAAAMDYLKAKPTALAPRFDVVEVYLDRTKRWRATKVNHIPDAFGANTKVRR